MLTPGNVSDLNAAPALIERARRMRYLLDDMDAADRRHPHGGLTSSTILTLFVLPTLAVWVASTPPPLTRLLSKRRRLGAGEGP